jgi:hypothetical protein
MYVLDLEPSYLESVLERLEGMSMLILVGRGENVGFRGDGAVGGENVGFRGDSAVGGENVSSLGDGCFKGGDLTEKFLNADVRYPEISSEVPKISSEVGAAGGDSVVAEGVSVSSLDGSDSGDGCEACSRSSLMVAAPRGIPLLSI